MKEGSFGGATASVPVRKPQLAGTQYGPLSSSPYPQTAIPRPCSQTDPCPVTWLASLCTARGSSGKISINHMQPVTGSSEMYKGVWQQIAGLARVELKLGALWS